MCTKNLTIPASTPRSNGKRIKKSVILPLAITANQVEKKTPFYDTHVAFGAKMAPFAGYLMPIRYEGDTAEHLLIRQGVGVFDVSHMGEFLFRGSNALTLLQKITTNDVSKIPVGKAQYNCMPNATGGIVDDLIVYRLEDELYLMVVNASNMEKDWNWVNQHNDVGATVENISEDTALLAVSGPKAIDVVQKITDKDITGLPYYAAVKATVAGLPETLIATTGYTGERTYEIFVRNKDAQQLWDALFEAGKDFGIKPTGLAARDTLRLEMGYMLYGNDITDETNPISAGLGWITKFDKGAFVSSDIIKEQKEKGFSRKLVAFEVLDKGIPRSHYKFASAGKEIGEVTSGTYSPLLKKGIGMAYVDTAFSAIGTELDLIIRDQPVKCKVVKAPFVSNTSVSQWLAKK